MDFLETHYLGLKCCGQSLTRSQPGLIKKDQTESPEKTKTPNFHLKTDKVDF